MANHANRLSLNSNAEPDHTPIPSPATAITATAAMSLWRGRPLVGPPPSSCDSRLNLSPRRSLPRSPPLVRADVFAFAFAFAFVEGLGFVFVFFVFPSSAVFSCFLSWRLALTPHSISHAASTPRLPLDFGIAPAGAARQRRRPATPCLCALGCRWHAPKSWNVLTNVTSIFVPSLLQASPCLVQASDDDSPCPPNRCARRRFQRQGQRGLDDDGSHGRRWCSS